MALSMSYPLCLTTLRQSFDISDSLSYVLSYGIYRNENITNTPANSLSHASTVCRSTGIQLQICLQGFEFLEIIALFPELKYFGWQILKLLQ